MRSFLECPGLIRALGVVQVAAGVVWVASLPPAAQ